jgi:uncharacterized protein YjiS (DUF1127 family)
MKAENLKLNQWSMDRLEPDARGFAAVVGRWIERARERNTLAHLDDIAKRDLGISDSDVWAETRKAPWRA